MAFLKVDFLDIEYDKIYDCNSVLYIGPCLKYLRSFEYYGFHIELANVDFRIPFELKRFSQYKVVEIDKNKIYDVVVYTSGDDIEVINQAKILKCKFLYMEIDKELFNVKYFTNAIVNKDKIIIFK